MGTLRASASVDQMRNVQRTASRGGAWVSVCAEDRGKVTGAVVSSHSNTARAGAIIVIDVAFAVAAEVGFVGFCWGKMHDFIFAQQAMHGAFCVPGMLIAHAFTGIWGARISAKTSKMAIIVRRNIGHLIAGIKAFVQSARLMTARRRVVGLDS